MASVTQYTSGMLVNISGFIVAPTHGETNYEDVNVDISQDLLIRNNAIIINSISQEVNM